MFKLILIELKKILFRKSVFVMMIIMLLFNLLNNILFYTDYDIDGNYKYLESDNLEDEKSLLENEIKKYDYNKESDISLYVELKTKLDVLDLKEKYKVGYVGDGLNDAPSLTLADVGFSMGLKGISASIEASDIVIANDNPEKISQAVEISKFTRKIVCYNICGCRKKEKNTIFYFFIYTFTKVFI